MSDAAAPASAPKKKGKKPLIVSLAAVLLLGAGGGGYFFVSKQERDPEAEAAKAEEKRKAARTFVTLEPFVVNLADRDSERYAQIGLVLEVESKDLEAKLAAKMPAVRNEILLLISSRLANQLTTREGKEQLAAEIAVAAARPLGWTPSDDRHDEPDSETAPPKVKTKDGADKGKAKDGADKGKAKDGKHAKAKPKKVEPPSNPIAHVHFSSFIVQ
jgi:flagellar FliL protein